MTVSSITSTVSTELLNQVYTLNVELDSLRRQKQSLTLSYNAEQQALNKQLNDIQVQINALNLSESSTSTPTK